MVSNSNSIGLIQTEQFLIGLERELSKPRDQPIDKECNFILVNGGPTVTRTNVSPSKVEDCCYIALEVFKDAHQREIRSISTRVPDPLNLEGCEYEVEPNEVFSSFFKMPSNNKIYQKK